MMPLAALALNQPHMSKIEEEEEKNEMMYEAMFYVKSEGLPSHLLRGFQAHA